MEAWSSGRCATMSEFMELYDRELGELARRLRFARSSAGLSKAEAANRASITESELTIYEKARMEPLTTVVCRLALVYGVSADWLLGMSDPT